MQNCSPSIRFWENNICFSMQVSLVAVGKPPVDSTSSSVNRWLVDLLGWPAVDVNRIYRHVLVTSSLFDGSSIISWYFKHCHRLQDQLVLWGNSLFVQTHKSSAYSCVSTICRMSRHPRRAEKTIQKILLINSWHSKLEKRWPVRSIMLRVAYFLYSFP